MSTSPLNKNLFAEAACVSHSLLQQYAENKLAAPEKHELENHLLDCEFCSKALDGFLAVSVSGDEIRELNKKIDSLSFTKPVWSGSKLILSVAMAAIIIAGVAVIIKKQLKINFLKEIAANKNVIRQKMVIQSPKTNLIVIKNPEMVKLLEEEMKRAQPIKKNTLVKNTFFQTPNSKSEIKIDFAEKIQTSVSSNNATANELEKSYSGSNEIFIENLKVSNYNKYYTFEEKYSPPSSPLIEPRFANKNDKLLHEQNNLNEKQNTFSADRILRKALQNFNTGDYRMCISLLDLLIQNNENDVNALFYSAISFEHINMADKAITYLDKILRNENKSFYEEARWHKALSLIKKKEKESAKMLLKEISEENGFYSGQAKSKINEQ